MSERAEGLVAISAGISGYPLRPPFHPGEAFPESLFPETGGEANAAYAGVRRLLGLLGLDEARRGTPAWNPLGGLVRPGDRVVIKPNLVRHRNGAEPHLLALVTHPSVVRAVLDYVLIALEGRGDVTVGDSPVQECDFDALVDGTGLRETVQWVAARSGDVPVRLIDFRKERAHMLPGGVVLRREALPGDPLGYLEVDLGTRSWLAPLAADAGRFRVTNYDKATMPGAHDAEHNRYLISGSVLAADVVINLPKMKTHGKAGITCTLKNNVGINGHKSWLPHHRDGSREEGGDEYEHRSARKRLLNRLNDGIEHTDSPAVKKTIRTMGALIRRTAALVPFRDGFVEGAWHGNDTVWRMVLDLNRILLNVDAKGILRPGRQRRYFGLVDGIVAGEGEGPLRPTSRAAGVLVGGFNPVPIDLACCHLMGFNAARIPLLREAVRPADPPLFPGGVADVHVRSDDRRLEGLFELPREETLALEPPSGWVGRMELASRASGSTRHA
jgi:uncharacterized protein (DUF362 family)